ncbi:MAG: hypothetical protein AB8B77_03540, partial [Alphaproteobacteria bacterium]
MAIIIPWTYLKQKEIREQLNDPDSRKKIHDGFEATVERRAKTRWGRFAAYPYHLGNILNWVNQKFDSEKKPEKWRDYFSANGFDFSLRLAVLYPILFGFLFWLFTNQDPSTIGLFPAIEQGIIWKKALIVLAISMIIFGFYQSNRTSGWQQYAWLALA